ncbi:MAG: thioredoxin family protein [Bacteroidales bacterium]|nr:thioredoxin family protein [Bacteroidales bacterium]
MKKITVILFAAVMVILTAARFPGGDSPNESNTGIQFFEGNWEEAQALAKAENKPIFLDLSTAWCGYCKRMKSKVYTDPDVGQYYNANFVNVSFDAEKGEGIALAKKYGVRGYPTFVFIMPDGTLAKQTSGYHKPDEFLDLAKSMN